LTQPQPFSVKEIQEQVLDDETMLLEYALGNERSFLWAVTSTTINSFVLPKRALIDSLAQRVYELLTARHQTPFGETQAQKLTRVAPAENELPKALSILSQIVLGPTLKLLENKRLLIVSDGALQYIPFAALPVPASSKQFSVFSKKSPVSGKQTPLDTVHRSLDTEHWSLNTAYWPLIADHEIVSLPSASVLAMLRHELANRELAGKTVAVFADPVYTANDPRLGQGNAAMTKKAEKDSASDKFVLADALTRAVQQIGLADSREGLRRLIFSRREAEGIMQLVPGGKGRLAVDFEANHETAISAGLSDYRIVHFATHGLLNSAHPELSGIVLSLVNEKGEQQDGFLRLHEIYNLNLPADLIVLSGCQTALGKEIKGEGLVGLTRGFMYAGAARVVASLWSVQDDATAELMKRFYQKMLGKAQMRPAAALRAAQVETWKTKRWQSPFYWASFILQGEWR
jgi:CHAT domain-containing protein